ncbi:hypothetical protein BDW67DRAFT_168484 [Aspergillus spinulosporus]
MRSVFSFLTALAAISVGAAAFEVSVITFGSETQKQGLKSPDVSTATLQQLLELRSRSPTTSSLQNSDEDNIEFLNRLAGPPTRLFGAPAADGGLDALLVVLGGLTDEIGRSIQAEYQDELSTTAFVTGPAKDTFLDYILEPRPEGIVSPESKHCSLSSDTNNEGFVMSCLPANFNLTFSGGFLDQITIGESWVNRRKELVVMHIAFKVFHICSKLDKRPMLNISLPKYQGSTAYLSNLKSFLSDLRSLSLNGRIVTAVALPDLNASHKLTRLRRAPEHTALDTTFSWVRDERPMIADQHAQASLSLAPVCYASNSSCNDATNTCSGHGVCHEKSGGCYACLCHDTYIKTASGAERKIRWGGSACQKRDISTPFFLIMGVTVAVLLAVISAIAMVFGLGNDELPGVISAGVGTARAQK